jgi:hypothetical protein
MGNIFDYLSWRGDLSFAASPFNPVDNIIFSQLSYFTLDGIVPSHDEKYGISVSLALKIYSEKLLNIKQTSTFKEDPDLIPALVSSKRFGNCQLFGYINHFDIEREIQFSALCIYMDDGSCFIVFRGTDSSLVGWKEDFNMSFREIVPSQSEAVDYLKKMASRIKGPLRIGGHSKGGNLAIYAAANCGEKIQKRLKEIYSNDAPGFHESFIESKGYAAIRDRIHSFVPQSSIIGMFLEHGDNFTVIKSSQSGLSQHDLYSWEVTHNDLLRAEKATISSRFVNSTLREWIKNLDIERRKQIIEALYTIFSEADIESTSVLETSWLMSVGRMLKSLNNVDETTKKLIRKAIAELFRSAGRNIETFLNPEH